MLMTFEIFLNCVHQQQDWITYRSRLLQWFIANEIDGSSDEGVKRRAILHSALPESSYQLATNLLLPNSLEADPYRQIVAVLDSHIYTENITIVPFCTIMPIAEK